MPADRGRRLAVVAVAVLLLAGIAAFLRLRQADRQGDPAAYGAAYRGLCETSRAAATDIDRARDIFYVQSHTALHVLAEELTAEQPALTARLLESKNRVEADLGGSSNAQVESSMQSLLVATQRALDSLGVPVESCDA